MPGISDEFGKYNAKGIKGGEAVARQLDRLVTYIRSPVDSPRGLAARLRYLTTSVQRQEAARAAGLTVADATTARWLAEKQKPSKANLARIEHAYRTIRRDSVAQALRKRLEADGGTRIEIHPADNSRVPQARQRSAGVRSINVRNWGPIVDAWARGDQTGLNSAWIDLIQDLGSSWGMYEYVTNVGFAA
jgi:hypothetical protein